jgi:hypothetical protein
MITRTIQNSKGETVGVIVFDELSWRIRGSELTFGTEQQALEHWRANYDPETGEQRQL